MGTHQLTCCEYYLALERIPKDNSTTEINDLHNAVLVDNDVVQLQIAMCEAHAVQVADTTQNLQCAACNLLFAHFTSHDRGEEIERRIFHDFVPITLFMDNIDRLDDIAVMEGGADTELGRDLLVVLFLALVRVPCSKLLDRKRLAVASALHKPDRAACARAKDSPELSVFRLQTVVVAKRHATVSCCRRRFPRR